MPTESKWALPTLQLLNLFFKTYSYRIPDENPLGGPPGMSLGSLNHRLTISPSQKTNGGEPSRYN
jgi:hypothetical protein